VIKRPAVIIVILISFIMLVASGCGSDEQNAGTPADFYRGNTINFIISSSSGGETDRVSRVIASFLERDTGANVVITNDVGAGGLEGINQVYRSKPDGLTLGAVSSGKFVANRVMGETVAVYELEEFSYIMNVGARRNYFMVSPDGPYQSFADLEAGENIKIGGASPSGPYSLAGMTVIELMNLDAKVITGLTKTSDLALAVKRGEIDGYTGNIPAAMAYLDSGMIEPMFVLATTRDSLNPDIPAITELVSVDDEDLALVELWETAFVSSSIFTAPPGVPEDRLAFLRGLAAQWMQDEVFRAEIDRVSGYDVGTYVIGDTISEVMLNLGNTLEDFRAIFTAMIEKYRA